MLKKFAAVVVMAAMPMLTACQSANLLPELEAASVPSEGPNVVQLVKHIRCELAETILLASAKTANEGLPENLDSAVRAKALSADDIANLADRSARAARIKKRLAESNTYGPNMDRLSELVGYMRTYHFVATIQLTLEVTDNEGFTPSLSFINLYGSNSSGRSIQKSIGGQVTGTQDRSLTLNYYIDTADLTQPIASYCGADQPRLRSLPTVVGSQSGGIYGDLGLADIVLDGLAALDESSAQNGGSGVTADPTFDEEMETQFLISNFDRTKGLKDKVPLDFKGRVIVSPPAAGTLTGASVTLIGRATSPMKDDYAVNLNGSVVSSQESADKKTMLRLFTVSGSLTQVGTAQTGSALEWGFSPTITLSGQISQSEADGQISLPGTTLNGMLTPAQSAGTDKPDYAIVEQQTQLASISVPTIAASANSIPPPAASTSRGFAYSSASTGGGGGGGGGGGKGGAAGGASGSSSFGSTVDFTLVYGLNGGPNWTLTNFKGPGGTTPLLSATHQRTDTLSITFVPACRMPDDASKTAQASSAQGFWAMIPYCQSTTDLRNAIAQSTQSGQQNNLSMTLRQGNFRQLPQ